MISVMVLSGIFGCSGDGEENGNYLEYAYIMIEDLEASTSEQGTGGVDIDAIGLSDGGSHLAYAGQIHDSAFGTGDNMSSMDVNAALGAPDDQVVSLGGTGGRLILSFENGLFILPAYDITIYVGADDGVAEHYAVRLGVSSSASDPNWYTVNSDASGEYNFTVSSLPKVSAD
jgi:hypothetical protein